MKLPPMMLALLLSITGLCGVGQAQPILKRVEQLLRDQVDAARNPTAAPATPGYFGVIADNRPDGSPGVQVLEVPEAGPAALGGLEVGDIITAVDATTVRNMDDLSRALTGKAAGTKIRIKLTRAGLEQQHEVTLGVRPARLQGPDAPSPAPAAAEEIPLPGPPAPDHTPAPDHAPAPRGPRLGVRTVDVTPEVQRANRLPALSGALVTSVTPGSPAARAGIPLGAVITLANIHKVSSPADLAAAVQQSQDEIELTYVVAGKTTSRLVTFNDAGATGGALPQRVHPIAAPAEWEQMRAALETRIRELEQRVEKLEASMRDAKQ